MVSSLDCGRYNGLVEKTPTRPDGCQEPRISSAGNQVAYDRRPDPVPRTRCVCQRSQRLRLDCLRPGSIDHHDDGGTADRTQSDRRASSSVVRAHRSWIRSIRWWLCFGAKAMCDAHGVRPRRARSGPKNRCFRLLRSVRLPPLEGDASIRWSGAGQLLLAYFEVGRSISLASKEYRTASPRCPSNSMYDLRRAS